MPEQRIAIVGVGGLFPSAASPEQLWDRVVAAEDTARPVPPGRWLLAADEAYDPAVPRADGSTRGPRPGPRAGDGQVPRRPVPELHGVRLQEAHEPLQVEAGRHHIRCKYIVIATHTPLMGKCNVLNATLFQSKLALYTSYVLGARLPRGCAKPFHNSRFASSATGRTTGDCTGSGLN